MAYCGHTKSLFAHAVPRKGADDEGYIVEQLTLDILWLGHARVMVRSDNEPALLQVVDRVMASVKMKGVDATNEGSVPFDPQSNGAAEGAVLLKGSMRTLLLCLENRVSAKIPLDHPLLAWLVVHAAYVRTCRVRGKDGRTAQQRARGTTHPDRLMEFGEACRYKCRSKEGGIGGKGPRWSSGTWIGVDKRTGQYILYDRSMGGIRYARTLLPMPEPQRWLVEQLRLVAATPWSPHASDEPEVIHHQADAAPGARGGETQDRLAQSRRLYIRQADLDQHGYTKNCQRCQHIIVNGPGAANIQHSEECRTRLTEAINKLPEGQLRIQKIMHRGDRFLAEYLRRANEGPDTAAQGGSEDSSQRPAESKQGAQELPEFTPAESDLPPLHGGSVFPPAAPPPASQPAEELDFIPLTQTAMPNEPDDDGGRGAMDESRGAIPSPSSHEREGMDTT